MDPEQYFAAKIRAIEAERLEAIAHEKEIRVKLDVVEARRRTDPENEEKWKELLKDLEDKLDHVKARHVRCDAEIQEKKAKLAQLREAGHLDGTVQEVREGAPPEHAAEGAATAEEEGPFADAEANAILKRILTMSPEELAGLSIDELAILQEWELSQQAATAPAGGAGEAHGKLKRPLTPEERRRQEKLRAALAKVVADDFYGLTLADLDAMAASLLHFANQEEWEEGTKRLVSLIEQTMSDLEGLYDAWQRKREQARPKLRRR